jgi:glycosyltransferase involved in cell wall biosynthesis
MKLSIIIPVFSGGDIIKKLYSKIDESLFASFEYEVLFICDGCECRSLAAVREIRKTDPLHIKIFRFAQNYGQHKALQFGFGKAQGDYIITMDEDLQHDPADILKLIEKQREGNYDIVYGRFIDPQHLEIRNRISSALRKILKHFIPTLFDNYSPYRLIKRDVAIRTSTMVCPYTFIDDFLSRVTQNIAFEDIDHHKRMEGKSSYTIMKLFKHGIYILLAYSKLIPLLLITSILFFITGSIFFTVNFISSESLDAILSNDRYILVTFAIGMILLFISLIGSFINHRNTIINTRPIELLHEDSV